MKYFRDFLKKILRHPPAATEGAETPDEDRDRKVLEPVTEYSEESSFGWHGQQRFRTRRFYCTKSSSK